MNYKPLPIKGSFEIELDSLHDERGFFARSFCQKEFGRRDMMTRISQCNISYNEYRGTLRGMHYQKAPNEEAKLVRCTMGAIYDVIVDLRTYCSSFGKWVGVRLSSENRKMLYIPEGVAHGFLTLDDDTEIFYQMSAPYAPESASGVRWDDPLFSIEWPGHILVISERDQNYPDFVI